MYWVGMDTDPRTTPEALAEFNRFYSTTHVHEVIAAHPGFVSVNRYELLEPRPTASTALRGGWPSTRLRTRLPRCSTSRTTSARGCTGGNTHPGRRHVARPKPSWRMLWHQRSLSGADGQVPESVFMVGTNDERLPELSAGPSTDMFQTHLELYRAFAPPEPDCPRFCAIYATATPGVREAWEARDAAWRLVYRRIPAPDEAQA